MSLADELGELDPDFAPRNHPINDSLGASFGSHPGDGEEDDEVDPYARSLDALGDGFGMGGMGQLLAELSDGEGEGGEGFGSGWGNPVGQEEAEGPSYRTPRRRTASESSRNSLAFELASASKPAAGGSRDLLRELGIEEEDEGEDDGGREEYSDEDEDQFGQRSSGFGVPEPSTPTVGRRGSLQPPASQQQHSPPTTPLLQRRMLSSHGSSASLANGFQQASEVDDEAKAAEAEAAHAALASHMTDSLAATSAFLATLRNYTTAPDQPTASTSTSTRANNSLLSTPAPSTPATATATAVASPVEGPLDRQPVVEGLAGGVIKTMYELVREREQQVRELADFERQVSRQDAGWQAALSQVDDFDDEGENDHANDHDDQPENHNPDPSAPPPTSSPPLNGTSTSPLSSSPTTSPALQSLSALQSTTASLLATLSALHESSQVALAAGSESARKLRALRGQAQATQEDLAVLARSEEYVIAFERDEAEAAAAGRERGWRGRMAREELERAGRGLEEGWERARGVLVVG